MTKRKSKTAEAAIVTETSDAIALMAMDLIDGDTELPPSEVSAELDVLLDPIVLETTSEIEQAVQVLEAIEPTVQEAPATETVVEGETEVQPTGNTWNAALAELTDDEITSAALTVAAAMDDRAAWESVHGHPNIQRTLKKARAQLVTKRAAAALLVAGFNESQINRSVHDGARYNVYALGKLADVIYAVSGGAVNNAINHAITRSLFRFKKAGKVFSMDMAKAAASDKIKVEDRDLRALLIRHTVSAGTAPTQASSTMQALVDLGVVSRTGSERNPIFSLTDAPIVEKLQAVLQAA